MGVQVAALSSFFADVVGSLVAFWPLLTFVGGVLCAATVSLVAPILQEDGSFKQICDWASKPGLAARYRDLIATGLHATTRLYGPAHGLSWRGYFTCLLVAFLYPFLLWHLAWTLDGPGTIAGTNAFDEAMPGDRRWFGLVTFWALLIFLGYFSMKSTEVLAFITGHLMRIVRHTGLMRTNSEFQVPAVGAGVAVIAVVAVVAVVAVEQSVIYLTFLLIVPVVNAVLDHVSVQISRWLLSDLVVRRGATWQRLMVFGHIMADVIAAAVFLVILAVFLPVTLQLANRAFDTLGWPLVEWGLYLDAARREPFGAGLLVTGMLATTLIPTVLHLIAAGGALALPQIGGGTIRRLADKAETTLLDRVGFVGLTVLSVFLSWAVLVVVSVGLWEASEAFLGPLGVKLADLAEGVGRAIGGPGAPKS